MYINVPTTEWMKFPKLETFQKLKWKNEIFEKEMGQTKHKCSLHLVDAKEIQLTEDYVPSSGKLL